MESKKILITGGTGFIGSYLSSGLLEQGHYITIVTRSPEKYAEQQADNKKFTGWENGLADAVNEAEVIINLVGENLFGRWTEHTKKKIYNSRIHLTRKLVNAIGKSDQKPDLLISASGVSIYGDHGHEVINETTEPADSFLGKVCRDWELEARKAENFGVRVAMPRISPVLESDGGMIEKMKLPFLLFLGGPVGSGNQYIPWIHMRDLCNALLFPVHNKEFSGAYNACSPHQTTMNELAGTMGDVMNRPAFFRVPEFVVKMVLGEGSQPALESLRVEPAVLQAAGFRYEFADLSEALADIL